MQVAIDNFSNALCCVDGQGVPFKPSSSQFCRQDKARCSILYHLKSLELVCAVRAYAILSRPKYGVTREQYSILAVSR